MADKIYEQDWAECPYVGVSYEEWDTGYKEYSCALFEHDSCYGGDIEAGCPLAFKYTVEED